MTSIVSTILIFGLLSIFAQAAPRCYSIHKGHHYTSWGGHFAIKSSPSIKARIKLDPNTAHYIIPPTEDVHRCQGSWNKLFGASRCAQLHHRDSDRFVWRRSRKCYKIEGNKVIDIPDCPEAGKLEIAAYAYDNGEKPFQHYGTLLKPFKTLVDAGKWYKYQIDTSDEYTRYYLYTDEGELLETTKIKHRKCWFTNWGYMLGFYFGGACPAPKDFSACYEYL